MDQKMNPHTDPYYKMDPQADIYYKMHPQVDSYNQMKPYPYQQMEYFKGPEEFSQKALSKDSQPQHPYYLQQNFQQYPAYYWINWSVLLFFTNSNSSSHTKKYKKNKQNLIIQAAYWLAYCSALSFYACSILFLYSYAAFHIS